MHDLFCIQELYLSAEPRCVEGDVAENFNTDVIVLVREGGGAAHKKTVKYIASFFTYDNIIALQVQHAKTGEYLNGKYFYSKNMVLIDRCSIENVRSIVEHLLEEGEFAEVFRKI